jgi:hypothetical protein
MKIDHDDFSALNDGKRKRAAALGGLTKEVKADEVNNEKKLN